VIERLHPDLAKMAGKKWVACFDLLGFSQETHNSILNAFCLVERCLLEAQQNSTFRRNVGCAWFSDTFLFYTSNDSESSFDAVEFVSRNFFEMAILRNIPLRGAMSCDEFYADETNRIFIGRALVDAFRLGEKCNWVGYVLCPSAVCQIEKLTIDARRISYTHYKLWDVPTKKKTLRNAEPLEEVVAESSERMSALLCGDHNNNGEDFMRQFKAMSESTVSPKEKRKYTNSIQFLNHFGIPK
jgi:hypothetical protein